MSSVLSPFPGRRAGVAGWAGLFALILTLGPSSLVPCPSWAQPAPQAAADVALRSGADVPGLLTVLSYNVFLRAPTFFFRDRQAQRAEQLPDRLRGYDVVILQEAFSDSHRDRILRRLAVEYPYQTQVLQGDQLLRQDGGVVLLSRWPIEYEDQRSFGSVCASVDCLVTKGVIYARINKAGIRYHVFGTHVQAGEQHQAVRGAQLRMLKRFIDAHRISEEEPVLIGGDLNVDLFSSAAAYTRMLQLLDASHPLPRGGTEYQPSRDASNSFVDRDLRQRLDYILFSNGHLLPQAVHTRVNVVRGEDGQDLSDHAAVSAYFQFDAAGYLGALR
jgi:endonuclease/exonuclease/phosphatase family metal-dependent hydrolase